MKPDEFASHDGMDLAGLVRRREVSATEVLDAAIAAVEAGNPVINAVVCRLYGRAPRGCPPTPSRACPVC